jgi:peptidyl-prolyl cis-trans isomerase B (cyclophilin B)
MLEDNASLDGDYAAFGRVLKGLETVDSIGKVMVDKNDKPLKDITIKSVEFVRLNNE